MLARACIVLLCQLVLELFMCLFCNKIISEGSCHFGGCCINCRRVICFL